MGNSRAEKLKSMVEMARKIQQTVVTMQVRKAQYLARTKKEGE